MPGAIPVLMIGPPATQVGGMATVVAQLRALPLGDRYAVRFFPLTFGSSAREAWPRRISRHIAAVARLGGQLLAGRPAIVHLHTCSGVSFLRSAVDGLLARLAGSAVVLHVHGAVFDEFFAGRGRIGRGAIRSVLQNVDVVLALSARWKARLQAMAPRARIQVLENASPYESHERPARTSGPCRFLTLARMDTWKGVDDLLAAFGLLALRKVPFEAVLAGPPGSAGEADTLARKIHEHGLRSRVRYLGAVEGESKLELLRWPDAYVQPSRHEGLPVAVLEALSVGLPIVATTVGAMPEVLTDGVEGLLVEARNVDGLAAALEALALNPKLRVEMGKAASALARSRFSMERLERDVLGLYDRLLHSDRRRLRRPRPALQPVR